MPGNEAIDTPPSPPVPCPFCGGHPECVRTSSATWIRCGDCCAEGPVITSPQADLDAIEAWNRREVEDELRQAEARDAARYRALRSQMTFHDTAESEAPVLASVSKRIWYHATDCLDYPLDAVADAAGAADAVNVQTVDAAPADPAAGAWHALSQAARDVLCERQRQVSVEGYTTDHDDEHKASEMALAAGCYAVSSGSYGAGPDWPLPIWPWALEHWKPTFGRRDLVRAGALILAEVERLDRAADKGANQ